MRSVNDHAGSPAPDTPHAGGPSPHIIVVGDDPDIECLAPLRDRRITRCGAGELDDMLPDADILFVWSFATPELRSHWSSAARLAWIHTATAGVDNVLFPELAHSPVLLTNSRGIFETAIAEYVLGLLIALAKDLPATLANQRARKWEHRETDRVAGRHLVLIGAGPIAVAVARLARCISMTVEVVARRERRDDPVLGHVRAAADLRGALERADDVVIAAPLTSETHGLVGRDALSCLRPGSRLINVGRGAVLDHEALVEALEDGRIVGAALDVFDVEPLPPNDALWSDPRVIVSPHMAGDVKGWQDAVVALFVANLERYLAGEPLANVVDKSRGYGSPMPD